MEKNQVSTTTSLICIGGSAGSLQVVLKIFSQLHEGFSIPFLLVLHRNSVDSGLDELLSSKTNLHVKEIEDKDLIQRGYIYVCPADYHVLIETSKQFSLDYSEKINYSRPSIDVVFKSAADVFQDELLAILLSGANADGTEGLKRVRETGGRVIIQNPDDAEMSYMPGHALEKIKANKVLTEEELAPFINSLD